jgi:hypothetical protein
MVKTTYALTLFAAVSIAAPVAQPDGSGNLLGAGAEGGLNKLVSKLTARGDEDTTNEHKNLIEEIPILGPMLGAVSRSCAIKACETEDYILMRWNDRSMMLSAVMTRSIPLITTT